ncbi:putative ATP-dependent RNA helicase spindle-E [Orchesella cincta]|uniref:Putative ATP-dependent RNA helicase spindle-E n=1 Tax=Orchesella cincta TaxID=48709 RepID=A0A1D2NB58_ORCCI|nr:putative ATP-dependent RNA helicase spindle-E [Orchesella cincta]
MANGYTALCPSSLSSTLTSAPPRLDLESELSADPTLMPVYYSKSGVPSIFLQPPDYIQTKSHFVKEGDEKLCVASAIYSPSDISLIYAKDFPKKVDSFAWHMTDVYNAVMKSAHRVKWIVNSNLVQDGMFLAVFRREDKEWLRGKVLNPTSTNQTEKRFMVEYIDFGDHAEVSEQDLAYLHKNFAHKLGWAIKCRLELDLYFDQYHKGEVMWKRSLNHHLHETLFDKRFRVKFIKKVIQFGEEVWEVSLLKFRDDHPMNAVQQPIQKQIILQSFDAYVKEGGAEVTKF